MSMASDPDAELYKLRVRYSIGDVNDNELALEAMRIIDASSDTDALRKLSWGEFVSREEAMHLLQRALSERGLRDDLPAAVQLFVLDVARKITGGELEPYRGARRIWSAAQLVPQTHDYDPFIYAASEYEDRPDDRAFFEAEIVKEAQRVATTGVTPPER